METNQIPQLVLFLVLAGMLLAVGILTLGKFSTTVRDSVTVTDEQVTMTAAAGTTAHGNITAWTSFYNATNSSDTYTLELGTNVTAASGAITTAENISGTWNVSYVYDEEGDASTTTNEVVEAVKPIASDWMPLIVTVAVLSIVLILVLKSFKTR